MISSIAWRVFQSGLVTVAGTALGGSYGGGVPWYGPYMLLIALLSVFVYFVALVKLGVDKFAPRECLGVLVPLVVSRLADIMSLGSVLTHDDFVVRSMSGVADHSLM